MTDNTIKSSPRTIRLKGVGTRHERAAGGTVTPGALVMFNSSDQIVVQSGVAVRCLPMFAVEYELFGKGIDDNYVANDTLQAEVFSGGDEVLAYVAAGATAVVEGDLMISAGDGSLKIAGSNPSNAVAVAKQSIDNSAGGSIARVIVAIL